jgi:hypothetical protein
MLVLMIGEHNRPRSDGGATHMVLKRLGPDGESRALLQITPKMAEDIAGYDIVIFIDSDTIVQDLTLEPPGRVTGTSRTHVRSDTSGNHRAFKGAFWIQGAGRSCAGFQLTICVSERGGVNELASWPCKPLES